MTDASIIVKYVEEGTLPFLRISPTNKLNAEFCNVLKTIVVSRKFDLCSEAFLFTDKLCFRPQNRMREFVEKSWSNTIFR